MIIVVTIVMMMNLEKLSLWTGEVKSGSFTAVSAHTLPTLTPCNTVFVFVFVFVFVITYTYHHHQSSKDI